LTAPAATEPITITKRNLVVAGVMVVIFLFAIDATIVSTSMPTIVARLGGLELYSWVFSVYMLSSALTTPIVGKLADLYSRRRLLLIGISIFLIGSALCGAAQSMEMMIGARAIQGLGGGAIYALAFIIVGVLYPAHQRARMQSIISGIWGVASIIGPLAGGIIVENWSWRWIFLINLPLNGIAIAFIVVGLKNERGEERRPALDLAGAGVLLIGLLLIFYGLGRGAAANHVLDAETSAIMTLGCAALMLFYFVERRATEAIVPFDLFHVGLFRSSVAVATLSSMGVFGAISYLPLQLQGVQGMSASATGLTILMLSMGWTVGSLLAGQGINHVGYRTVAVAGMLMLGSGYLLIIAMGKAVGVVVIVIASLTVGVGMGLANLTTLVAAQTAVQPDRIGIATATLMLFRTFGGAFAVSLMGTVLLARMQRNLAQIENAYTAPAPDFWQKLANPQNLLQSDAREQIPPDLLARLLPALADALWYAFATGFVLMIIGIAAGGLMSGHTPATTPKPQK
jgi:EmrB/QacA subfamily drug resistance transporter